MSKNERRKERKNKKIYIWEKILAMMCLTKAYGNGFFPFRWWANARRPNILIKFNKWFQFYHSNVIIFLSIVEFRMRCEAFNIKNLCIRSTIMNINYSKLNNNGWSIFTVQFAMCSLCFYFFLVLFLEERECQIRIWWLKFCTYVRTFMHV